MPRVPSGLDAVASLVHWHVADGSRFTDPFLDDTLLRMRRQAGADRTPVSTPLHEWLTHGDVVVRPDAVILHVSRCGSTLVSRMLAALPANLVVSEPRVVDDILRSGRDDVRITPDQRVRWLAGTPGAFVASQTTAPGRVILKLDCWHIFDVVLLRQAFPSTPLVFIYRDPLEVLVSLMRRPSFTLVRDTVTPAQMGITPAERDALTQVEHAAAILGAFFREAARQRAHLVPVSYRALPDVVWSALPGLPFTSGEVERLRAAALLDAKEPGRVFLPDADAKRAAADPATRAACARWATPAYDAWTALV